MIKYFQYIDLMPLSVSVTFPLLSAHYFSPTLRYTHDRFDLDFVNSLLTFSVLSMLPLTHAGVCVRLDSRYIRCSLYSLFGSCRVHCCCGGFVYFYLRNSVSRPFYPIRKTRIRAVLDRKNKQQGECQWKEYQSLSC